MTNGMNESIGRTKQQLRRDRAVQVYQRLIRIPSAKTLIPMKDLPFNTYVEIDNEDIYKIILKAVDKAYGKK